MWDPWGDFKGDHHRDFGGVSYLSALYVRIVIVTPWSLYSEASLVPLSIVRGVSIRCQVLCLKLEEE